jgi:surfeit locus 1 family protein
VTIAAARPRLGFGFWSFIAFMLALTVLWIGLGIWQVNRLAWKEGLIAEVSGRLALPPRPLPSAEQWAGLDLSIYSYRPVTASGHYLNDKSILVFTSLSDAKGRFSGPGYWVMTPFQPDDGGTVFVNRGFVPQASGPAFLSGHAGPDGEQTLTGVALDAEMAGAFTPGPDRANRIEWVRDPTRLAALAGVEGPVFGMTVDAPAGEAGALPQGGETVIDFPNNHLGYALTWFGFAILTPSLLAYWVWRRLRPKRAAGSARA